MDDIMISLTPEHMATSFMEITGFVIAVIIGVLVMELLLWVMLYRSPRNRGAAVVIRLIEFFLLFGGIFYVLFYEVIGKGTDFVEAFSKMFNIPGDLIYSLTGLDLIPVVDLTQLSNPWIVIGALLFILGALMYVLSKPKITTNELAYMLIAPAIVGILVLFIYPFLFEVRLAFADLTLTSFKGYRDNGGLSLFSTYGLSLENGIKNFVGVFTGSVAKDASFWDVLRWNLVWTFVNVSLHLAGGMGLALLLNRNLRFKGIYRTLLVIPWAIPQVIAAMAWRQEFNYQFGFINTMLDVLGFERIGWLQDPFNAKMAVIMVNVWLGIPFMAVIILGGLQSISKDYYEAAEMDGASAFSQWRNITVPMLRPVITPAVILGTVWTFNMFNVIWLVTEGRPQEKTDLLVTSLYKAFVQFFRYSHSAAFGLVIFAMLVVFSVIYLRVTGGLKSVYE